MYVVKRQLPERLHGGRRQIKRCVHKLWIDGAAYIIAVDVFGAQVEQRTNCPRRIALRFLRKKVVFEEERQIKRSVR